MGKKGSWFSAIKRVFTHSSKDKPSNEYEKKSSNEKKKGKRILRQGESKSFIPLFREPSSIEQILGEADQLLIRPPTTSSPEPKTTLSLLWTPASPRVSSLKAPPSRAYLPTFASPTVSSNRFTDGSLKTDTSKATQSRKEIKYVWRPEPTLRNRNLSATKIQSAYRGYSARRNFRALKGLVRLQGMVRSKNAKRQTMNAMKQMQLLVRVQTQIQTRRIQMLENKTLNNQGYKDRKEAESVTSNKWTPNQLAEAELNEDWDDSVLTKEELEARLQSKVEAVMKRERAMAYAYSHQLWKSSNPKSAQTPPENQPTSFSWWWNSLERQPPTTSSPRTQVATKKVTSSPPRPIPENKPSPQHNAPIYNNKHKNLTLNYQEPTKPTLFQTTPIRTPSPAKISGYNSTKYSKPRGNVSYSPYSDFPLRDDDSLTSCPPFSVPNYMTPTMSAKAKTRANSNPKERLQGTTIATPVNDSKRRFSFSFTPNIGTFKWNKGSSKNDSATQKVIFEKHRQYGHSIGDSSIDSAVSMPAVVGKRPFNRFV